MTHIILAFKVVHYIHIVLNVYCKIWLLYISHIYLNNNNNNNNNNKLI